MYALEVGSASFQLAFTCSSGITGLLRICATPLVASQSAFTCVAGITGLLTI